MAAARTNAPRAAIVHDKFHVSKYLGKAVDDVRKKEHRELTGEGSELLKGTKYLWLMKPEHWNERQERSFSEASARGAQGRAGLGDQGGVLRFLELRGRGDGRAFFRRWYRWATHSQLKPVADIAKTLQRHLGGLLTYLRHRITNAVTRGAQLEDPDLEIERPGLPQLRALPGQHPVSLR